MFVLRRTAYAPSLLVFVRQVMHKVILPHFDVDKSEGDRTFIYGCENDHG